MRIPLTQNNNNETLNEILRSIIDLNMLNSEPM